MLDFVINLIVDTAYSWLRILIALVISIILAWTVGILAARRESAERVLLPIFDVLQGVPILGFLPIILVVFVSLFPGSLGVDLAVIFLIFSGVGWSMAFAVYEGVRAIPKEILELADLEKMTLWRRIRTLYVPASWPRIAYNTSVFWSAAVFYLVSSEIFSLGSTNLAVGHGIGADLAALIPLSSQGLWSQYLIALAVLIVALALTRLLFLGEFSLWSEKFKLIEEPSSLRRDPLYRFYSRFDFEVRSRLFRRTGWLREANFSLSLKIGSILPRVLKFLAIGVGLLGLAYAVSMSFSYLLGVSAGLNAQVLIRDEWSVLVALGYSSLRVWGVYALSIVIGFPLGVFLGVDSRLYSYGSPVIQIVSSIPAPVYLPAAVFFLAVLPFKGELTAVLLVFLGMIWYIAFNVMGGVKSIPREIWEVVELSKMKRASLWRHILIPSALPSFVTGSITAVGGGWSVLIVAEYFQTGGSGSVVTQVPVGVGKLIDLAAASVPPDLTLMALSLISMTALIVIVNRLFWKRIYHIAITRFSYKR